MSNLLLDSNALISYVANARRIGPKTRRLLSKSGLFYSPLSLFELQIKQIRVPGFQSNLTPAKLEALGFGVIRPGPEDLEGFSVLKTKDPFDLMLVSQAKSRGFKFVTSDLEILKSGLDFVVDLTD